DLLGYLGKAFIGGCKAISSYAGNAVNSAWNWSAIPTIIETMWFRLIFMSALLVAATGVAPVSYAVAESMRNSPLQAFSWQRLDSAPMQRDTSTGNYLTLINNGYDAFLLRVHLIRNA